VPGYDDKIKRPMSFRVMEATLRAREYRTWRAVIADFEQIITNARTFNSSNSVIWRLAGQLQRNGRKLLAGEELSGRRALYALHPEGPRRAAADEEAQVLRDAAETGRLSGLAAAGAPATASVDGGAARSSEGGGGGAGGAGTAAAAAAAAAGAPGGADDPAALPEPPAEDAAAAARLWAVDGERLPAANDWGLLFREAPEPSADAVMQASRLSALFLPYGGAPAPGGAATDAGQQTAGADAQPGAADGSGEQQQQEGGKGGGRRAEPRLAASGRAPEWKAARRPVEWRARWLELRLLELGSVIAQLKAAPCAATRSGCEAAAAAAAAAAGAAATAAVGSSGGGKEGSGGGAAGGGGGGGGGEGKGASGADVQAPMALAQRGGVLLPSHVEALPAPAVLASPFFSRHASPPSLAEALALEPPPRTVAKQELKHEQQQQQQPKQEGEASGADAATAAAGGDAPLPPPGFDPSAHASDPAAVFGSLELVEKQLASMRLRLAAAFGIEVTAAPAGVRLGAYAAAKLTGRARGGGAGDGAARLAREGSGSLKRRRAGSSLMDEEFLLSPTAAPRMLERPVSARRARERDPPGCLPRRRPAPRPSPNHLTHTPFPTPPPPPSRSSTSTSRRSARSPRSTSPRAALQ
jgi:hypothetical protein